MVRVRVWARVRVRARVRVWLGYGSGLGLGFSLRGRVRVKGWPNIYKFTAPKEAIPIYSSQHSRNLTFCHFHFDLLASCM